ncbi:MAG: 5-formyltetrahydrofolate cyclo-ligase [Bacteroidetes bacterium]|nr:5-formyltetrahydrofolate cyclo-ligase [Bacteroidota bacterium]
MINEQKKALRQFIKKLLRSIAYEEKLQRSSVLFSKLEQHVVFQQAKTVMLYWSMEDEVQTHDFINKWAKDKEIILPVVRGDKLHLKKFSSAQSLIIGEKYGIQEPDGENFTDFNAIDLVIVPGVAFDKAKNRMGHGKGYYDGLLPYLRAYKIALCFNFQLVDEVPAELHDIKMDEIIAE